MTDGADDFVYTIKLNGQDFACHKSVGEYIVEQKMRLAEHDKRVTELLTANNVEVERRRAVERVSVMTINDLRRNLAEALADVAELDGVRAQMLSKIGMLKCEIDEHRAEAERLHTALTKIKNWRRHGEVAAFAEEILRNDDAALRHNQVPDPLPGDDHENG